MGRRAQQGTHSSPDRTENAIKSKISTFMRILPTHTHRHTLQFDRWAQHEFDATNFSVEFLMQFSYSCAQPKRRNQRKFNELEMEWNRAIATMRQTD